MCISLLLQVSSSGLIKNNYYVFKSKVKASFKLALTFINKALLQRQWWTSHLEPTAAVLVPLIICQQAELFTSIKGRKCSAGVLGQITVAHFRLTLQSLITAKTGPNLALVFDSYRLFTASDFIGFTAWLTDATVDEVVDSRRFTVNQILLVSICCTSIFQYPLARSCLRHFSFIEQFELAKVYWFT